MNPPTNTDPRGWGPATETPGGRRRGLRKPRNHRRSRPSSMRGRPIFSMVLAAAIVLGLPTIAYTGVNASTFGATSNSDASTHHIALDTQPALSAHGGGTGGHGRAGGAGAAGGA